MEKMESNELIEKKNKTQTYDPMFTFEIMFSVTMCVLLWNLTLLMDIRYGNKIVTHLSVWPYIVSVALCLVMLFEFLAMAYAANINFHHMYLQYLLKAILSDQAYISQVYTPI